MERKSGEAIRRAALEVLASRHPAAFPIGGVHRRIAQGDLLDEEPSPGELEAALEFLRGLGHVQMEMDPLGTTRYWSATSNGVLAWERGR